MRDLPSSTLHNLSFLLAFAVVGLLGWEGYRTQKELLAANSEVVQSLETISAVRSIRSSLQDVETGTRGYLITHRPEYLEPYVVGRERILRERNQLAGLLHQREPARTAWLRELDEAIARRLAVAAENVERRNALGLAEAANHLHRAGGKEAMDRARRLLDELEDDERGRLAQRQAAMATRTENVRSKTFIGAMTVVVLLLMAMWALSRNLRARRVLVSEAWLSAQRQGALLQALPDTLYEIGPDDAIAPISTPERDLREPPASLVQALLRARERAGLGLHTIEWQDERGNAYEVRLMPTGENAHVAIVRNVSEAQRTRRRLRDQQAFLRSVVDTDENIIFVRDQEGRFLLCNRAFSGLLGLRPAQIEGQPPSQLRDAELIEPLLAGDEALIASRLPELRTGDIEVIDVAGRPRWLQLLKRPLLTSDGRRQVLAVAVDVSQRREIERMKAEFVSTVSHELRTPLTAIRGALGMITSGLIGPLPEDASPLIEIAYKNSERLVTLINDILDIERLESGQLLLRLQEAALRPLLIQAIEQISPFARERGVQLELRDGPEASAQVDPDRFAQIMANLLSNAIKHSPAGGTVRAWLERGADTVEVSVADEGAGIPEEFRARVFERFAQADSSDVRARGGTGLGLAITRSLVEQMHGRIGFDSELGHGTRFWFTLPLDGVRDGGEPPRPRVLLADPEGASADRMADVLQRVGHYVATADSAAQVREILNDSPVHTLVLSLSLADEEPFKFLRRLRSQPRFHSLPVVVLFDPDDARPALQEARLPGNPLDIAAWLERPVADARLLGAVHGCLTQPGARPHVLHVEDDAELRLRFASRLAGQPIVVHSAANLSEARGLLQNSRYDLVVLDLDLPGEDARSLMPELAQARPPSQIVLFAEQDTRQRESPAVLGRVLKSEAGRDDLALLVTRHLQHWLQLTSDRGHIP